MAGLPGKFGDQVIDKILKKAAAPLIKQAKEISSNADVTGNLTRSIGAQANRKNRSITVGPRRGNGFKGYHAHLLEYGTAPHLIKTKNGKEREHPGSAAFPFMRPAYDETAQQMVESIKDQCREIILANFKTVFK